MAIKCLHRTHPPHHRTGPRPRRAARAPAPDAGFGSAARLPLAASAAPARRATATRRGRRDAMCDADPTPRTGCDATCVDPDRRRASRRPRAERRRRAHARGRTRRTPVTRPAGAIVTSVKRSHRTGWPQAGGWPASDLARQSSGAQWRPPALCGGERDEAPPPTPATDTPPSRTHTDTPPSRTHTLPPHGVRLIGHAPTARANRTHTRARVQITRDIRPHNAAHTHTAYHMHTHAHARTHAQR